MDDIMEPLDNDTLEMMVQKVVEWYALEDANNHVISQRLSALGIDESHHQFIRFQAFRRVQRATHRKGDINLLIGTIIILLGIILMNGVEFRYFWFFITILLVCGGYFFVSGIILKRSI